MTWLALLCLAPLLHPLPVAGTAWEYRAGSFAAVMATRGIIWHPTTTGYIVNGVSVDAVVSIRDGGACPDVYDARPAYRQTRLYLVPYQLCRARWATGGCADWGRRLVGAVVDCSNEARDGAAQDRKRLVIELPAREARAVGVEAYQDGGAGHIGARRWPVYAALQKDH